MVAFSDKKGREFAEAGDQDVKVTIIIIVQGFHRGRSAGRNYG
jgi:hypothetical protein